MDKITLHGKVFTRLIPCETIRAAIDRTAQKINHDYASTQQPPIFVAILNGSFMYCSELMQRLTFDCELSFVKLASYQGTTSGKISELIGLNCQIEGRDVIILEDIVETGKTIGHIYSQLITMNPRSIRVTSLFFKAECYGFPEIPVDYASMPIPDDFIVGFGLDYNGLGRNYRDIYSLVKA